MRDVAKETCYRDSQNNRSEKTSGKKISFSRNWTLWRSSKAATREAAQNWVDGSSRGVRSIEANGQARQVFSSKPACV